MEKKNWQAAGITAIVTGILYYPAFKLYQFLAKKWSSGGEKQGKGNHVHVLNSGSHGKNTLHRLKRAHKKPGAGLA